MRLFVVDVGGLRVAVPLESVVRISPLRSEGHAGATLAHVLGLPDPMASVVLHLRGAQGCTESLGVCASEGICDAPVHSLPRIVTGGRPLPLMGLAASGGGLLPVVDPCCLGSGGDSDVPVESADSPGEPPREGEPLLICALGAFTLRRRPLAVAVPLSAVAAVEPEREAVFLPGALGALVGLTRVADRGLPVYDAATLLGMPAARAGRKGGALVVLRHVAAALHVTAALRVERPAHWAPAAILAPLCHAACVGAIPARARWTAVLDVARLLQETVLSGVRAKRPDEVQAQ